MKTWKELSSPHIVRITKSPNKQSRSFHTRIFMMSIIIFSLVLLAVLSVQLTESRLIGSRWFQQKFSNSNLKWSTNGDRNMRIVTTSNKMKVASTIQATIFDSDIGDSDACYNCCCDRDVVCKTHGKSDATCQDNACGDETTCSSEGYTCPSYDCDAAGDLW
jgi:hypothetical protein